MTALRRRVPARVLVIAMLALALIAAAAIALARQERGEALAPRPASERPRLMLVTSLPLVFPEEFTLEGGGSKALEALETRYVVVPIGIAERQALGQARLLLMAHPLAQPAEALVELDRWVRGGGRVLLLADPKLDWPSKRPLGDRLRPPPSFADTGLLAHWGLHLEAPDEAGPVERRIDGREVLLSSPGALSGACRIAGKGLVARCAVGKGRATIIADSDWLQPQGATERQVRENLYFLLAELERLEEPIR